MCNWSRQRLEKTQLRPWVISWAGEALLRLSPSLMKCLAWPPSEPLLDDCDEQKREAVLLATLRPYIEKGAFQLAVAVLAMQATSRHQLEQKLARAGVPEAWVQGPIERLHLMGYLDDQLLGERLCDRGKRQARSKLQIQKLLIQKGLSTQVEISEEEQVASVKVWLLRWSARSDLLEQPRRYLQRLASRGFSPSVIQRAWQQWRIGRGEQEEDQDWIDSP